MKMFIGLFLAISFACATRAIAAEDTSPPPSSVTSNPSNVVRQVAIALAAGSEALQALRGAPIENSNLDRLNLPTPGMDCGIARSLMFVECRGPALGKKDAETMFARMMDDVQTALQSDSWVPLDAVPHADLLRITSYFHLKSNAQIDIGLVVHPEWETEPLYSLRVYGWKRF